MNRLEAGVIDTLSRWEREAILNMAVYMKEKGAVPFLVEYPTGKQAVRVEFVQRREGRGSHQSYATPYLDPGFVQFEGYNIEYRHVECNLATYQERQEEWGLPAIQQV